MFQYSIFSNIQGSLLLRFLPFSVHSNNRTVILYVEFVLTGVTKGDRNSVRINRNFYNCVLLTRVYCISVL